MPMNTCLLKDAAVVVKVIQCMLQAVQCTLVEGVSVCIITEVEK